MTTFLLELFIKKKCKEYNMLKIILVQGFLSTENYNYSIS